MVDIIDPDREDENPAVGLTIVITNGHRFIGRLEYFGSSFDGPRTLTDAFEYTSSIQQQQERAGGNIRVLVQRMCVPALCLPSLKSIPVPQDAIVIDATTLSHDDQKIIVAAIAEGREYEANMRAARLMGPSAVARPGRH